MSMSLPDAWVIAKLLCGHTLNGELATISAPWRPLADRLAALPLDDRQAAMDAALADRPDRDDIIMSLARADIDGPMPEADEDDEAGDGWGPIRLGTLPPVEPFPLIVLPGPARDLAEAAARSIGCPVDFPAVGDPGRRLGDHRPIGQPTDQAGILRLGIASTRPWWEARQAASPQPCATPWPRSWRSPEILYDEWRPRWTPGKPPSPSDGERNRPCDGSSRPTPRPRPSGRSWRTTRAGLIVAPDEMTKWVMSMDQYKGGKGGDRPFYLSAWNGEPVYIDRAKHMREPIVGSSSLPDRHRGDDARHAFDAARGDADGMTDSWPGCCSPIPTGCPAVTPRKGYPEAVARSLGRPGVRRSGVGRCESLTASRRPTWSSR